METETYICILCGGPVSSDSCAGCGATYHYERGEMVAARRGTS